MFQLALAMGRTVAELLDSISAEELSEWQTYYTLDPWGEFREDLRAGIVASVIANTHRDPKSRPSPFQPSDFMPDFLQEIKRERFRQQWQAFVSVMKARNQRLEQEEKETDGSVH